MKLKILIVEDDPMLAEAVSDYFDSKGWESVVAVDGEEAILKVAEDHFQLVLLDVMLPKQNGFSVCKSIRAVSDVPIFFITARSMEEDELKGYMLGADDYIRKPFSLPVLYAKAMAILARVRGDNSAHIICRGGIEIHTHTHEVIIKGNPCVLAPMEYQMLVFFLDNPNRIFTREQILIRFWGYEFEGNERVVDNHIKKLRKAIANSDCSIQTVRKAGYRMEVFV